MKFYKLDTFECSFKFEVFSRFYLMEAELQQNSVVVLVKILAQK